MIETLKHWFKAKKVRKSSIDTKGYSQALSQLLIELGYENGLSAQGGMAFAMLMGTETGTQVLYFENEDTFVLMTPLNNGWEAEEVAVCSSVSDIKAYHALEEKGTLEFAFKFQNPFSEETDEPTEYAYVYRMKDEL